MLCQAEWRAGCHLQRNLKFSTRAQNWLYEDGEDEKKSVYVAKLEELRKEGDAIEHRSTEWTARGPAAASLTALAGSYATAATSDDPKLAHISPENKQKVRCWLNC